MPSKGYKKTASNGTPVYMAIDAPSGYKPDLKEWEAYLKEVEGSGMIDSAEEARMMISRIKKEQKT